MAMAKIRPKIGVAFSGAKKLLPWHSALLIFIFLRQSVEIPFLVGGFNPL
jgi:hypothetical protein